jgi:hypothetical protein
MITGYCADRFEYAADLRRRRDVNALADLCTRADERVAVNHRSVST